LLLIASIASLMFGLVACQRASSKNRLNSRTDPSSLQELLPNVQKGTMLPVGLQTAWRFVQQKSEDPLFAFHPLPKQGQAPENQILPVVYRGNNLLRGLSGEFSGTGVRLFPHGRQEQAILALKRYGCGENLQPMKYMSLLVFGNKVEYQLAGKRGQPIQEWYINGPSGLEQGFTLTQSPCSNGETVVLELELTGNLFISSESNQSGIELIHADGSHALFYDQLKAVDAFGKELNSSIHIRSKTNFQIHVNSKGAQWPLVIDPLLWQEQIRLKGSGNTGFGSFGRALSISQDSILVGAEDEGAAYVFVRSGNQWLEQAKFLSGSPVPIQFGISVAINQDTALVSGIEFENSKAHIFVRNGSSWQFQSYLVPDSNTPHDYFSNSAAIWGDTAAISANRFGSQSTSVYVFVQKGGQWFRQAVVPTFHPGDMFGAQVVLQGDTLAIGAPGAVGNQGGKVYVYVRTDGKWQLQATLKAPNEEHYDRFGEALSLDGSSLVVGAVGTGDYVGAAYIFERSGNSWMQQAHLLPDFPNKIPETSAYFGVEVAISKQRVLVGSRDCHVDSTFYDGCVSVYDRVGSTWTRSAVFTSPKDNHIGSFGSSLAFDDDRAVIGTSDSYYSLGVSEDYAAVYTLRNNLGDACSTNSECAVACVDGICCNEFCDGPCAVGCSIATGSTKDGFCAPKPALDPGSPKCGTFRCDGNSTECGTSCTSSMQCALGHFCTAEHQCVAPKAAGATCTTAGECSKTNCPECFSNFCNDGVCCDANCSGSCQSCSAAQGASQDGTCTQLPKGTSVDGCNVSLCDGTDSHCPNTCTSDTDCKPTHYCNANHQCVGRYPEGVVCQTKEGVNCAEEGCRICQSNHCVDGVCCNTGCLGPCDQCNNSFPNMGKCSVSSQGTVPSLDCGASVCDGMNSGCADDCVYDSQCTSNGYCDNSQGKCKVKRALGDACFKDKECESGNDGSGHCVDGVCCSSVCSGTCLACSAPLKESGLNDGQCDLVKVGTDPHNQCFAHENTDLCGKTGLCNAFGSCAFEPTTQFCGAPICKGATWEGSLCDGKGTCLAAKNTKDCFPYACKAEGCASPCGSDNDCQSEFRCLTSTGTCVPRLSLGQECQQPTDCSSGFCVDGLCCDTPCQEQCQACGGKQGGHCGLVQGAPQGERPACETQTGCEGTCDGQQPFCAFPPACQPGTAGSNGNSGTAGTTSGTAGAVGSSQEGAAGTGINSGGSETAGYPGQLGTNGEPGTLASEESTADGGCGCRLAPTGENHAPKGNILWIVSLSVFAFHSRKRKKDSSNPWFIESELLNTTYEVTKVLARYNRKHFRYQL
jgi:hypothetical protein